MNNYIVKFKNDLKFYQTKRKTILKQCEKELELLEKIINFPLSLLCLIDIKEMCKKFHFAPMVYSIETSVQNMVNCKKNKKQKETKEIQNLYNKFSSYIENIKNDHIITQNIINAFENDKIKDPINDIEELFKQIRFTSLTSDEISRIIGMAISFNSNYAKRNKKHNIKNIDIIEKLAQYYNQDGTFKYNEDVITFKNLIEKYDLSNTDEDELFYTIFDTKEKYSIMDLVELLEKNNQKIKNNEDNLVLEDNIEKYDYTISLKTREFLQELKKYYKNGTIIAIPENLEEFYRLLENSELAEQEKKYIINLIGEELTKQRNTIILKYLNKNEQLIYEKSTKLLDSFNYTNGDTYALKQYIEELQTILNMLEKETIKENKDYLLSEVPTIIEGLSLICDRYTIEKQVSVNKLIFLTNKEGNPYIFDDIDSLDSNYKKAIYSLIPKIEKENQSQFRKVLNNEELLYSMYEVTSSRGHVAFVEVDSGIYVVVGANIPRNGYKALNNRLRANQLLIKKIETLVKNPETRNEILKSNEAYLALFIENNNINNKKLALKAAN